MGLTERGEHAGPRSGSRPVRAAFALLGLASLAVAVIGIVVPILPTTPFLLLSAACFARSSERLHRWLLRQAMLGPTIEQWQTSRSMTAATRRRAIVVVLLTFTVSVALVGELPLRLGLIAAGISLVAFLLRIPSRG